MQNDPSCPLYRGLLSEAKLGARKGAPPVAESSDRSGWAGTCLCTNEVQGKGLVPTRVYRQAILPLERNNRKKDTTPRLTPFGTPLERGDEMIVPCMTWPEKNGETGADYDLCLRG